jgi:protease I
MTDTKKVLMVVAPKNYRDEEYREPKKCFKKAGMEVVTASQGVKQAEGMLGDKVAIDLDLNEAKISNYAAVVLVGGTGASRYLNDKTVHQLIKQADEQKKVIGAICIAPTILANAGLLVNKNATAFHTQESKLLAKGANYTGDKVTQDGRIVTGFGPGAAKKFGEALVKSLK